MDVSRYAQIAGVLFGLLLSQLAWSVETQAKSAAGVKLANEVQQSVKWFDGKRYRTAWLSETEVVEILAAPVAANAQDSGVGVSARALAPGARVIKEAGRIRIWRLDASTEGRTAAAKAMARSLDQASRLMPVFYSSAKGGMRMALPGGVLVNFQDDLSDEQIRAWAQEKSLTLVRAQLPQSRLYLFEVEPGLAGLAIAQQLNAEPGIEWAVPDWWREVSLR